MASVTLSNSSWFLFSTNQSVSVSYNLPGGSVISLGSITIFVNPALPSSSFIGALVTLPLRDYFVGNTITASVSANAGMISINTFRMKDTILVVKICHDDCRL